MWGFLIPTTAIDMTAYAPTNPPSDQLMMLNSAIVIAAGAAAANAPVEPPPQKFSQHWLDIMIDIELGVWLP